MSLPKFPGSFGGQGVIVHNSNATAQAPVAATPTLLLGSGLRIPPGGLKVGDKFRWRFPMTKTAAGTATSDFTVIVGTLGTIADTARLTFTKPAGTAAVDEGLVTIEAVVRGVAAATTGILVGTFNLVHNLASTGHAQVPSVNLTAVSSAFDNTGDELVVSLGLTTGASDAITINLMDAEFIRPTAA